MPICVHCSTSIKHLVTAYGPNHLVCTRCKACGAFADPYVEHEAIIVAIDIILVKPRAYRHLLFNRTNLRLPDLAKASTGKNGQQFKSNDEGATPWSAWLRLLQYLVILLVVDSYLRWSYLCSGVDQDQQSMLRSYWRILQVTAALLATLHVSVGGLAMIYHRILLHVSSRHHRFAASIDRQDLQRFQAHLVPMSLLLSSLTPTFLLSLLLLWQPSSDTSGGGISGATQKSMAAMMSRRKDGWQWNEDSIDWAIRSLVSGLSAGVALGVVLPMQRTKIGAAAATMILLIGWSLQFEASRLLQMPFHSGVGILQTDDGRKAAERFCLR